MFWVTVIVCGRLDTEGMIQYSITLSFTSNPYPLLGGMLSQISEEGYEKLLLISSAQCVLRGGMCIGQDGARIYRRACRLSRKLSERA